MTAPYVIPENFTSYTDFVSFANIAVDGWIGVGILISIAVIVFVATKQYEPKRSLVATMFLTTISATFMMYLKWISTGWWIACVVCFFISYLVLYLQE